MLKSNTQNAGSPFVQVAKWIAVFPVGLGILWLVEVLLNLLLEWALDWRPEGLPYYVLFVGGGLVLIIAMILAGRLASITTAFLAPSAKTGIVLLGAVYVAGQTIRLATLLGEPESVWQHALLKIEFAIVVSIVFIFAYRAEISGPESELPPDTDAAQ